MRRTVTLDSRIERFINEMLADAIREGKGPRSFSGMLNFILMWFIVAVLVVPEIGELMNKHQDEIKKQVVKVFGREMLLIDANELRRLAERCELLIKEEGR